MTSPPGQDPTREALIVAEKALAPFGTALTDLDIERIGKWESPVGEARFSTQPLVTDLLAAREALAAVRAALSQPSAPTADTGTGEGWWRLAVATTAAEPGVRMLAKYDRDHIAVIAAQMAAPDFDRDKGITWLGWMQGYLERAGFLERDRAREINRKAKATLLSAVRPKDGGAA